MQLMNYWKYWKLALTKAIRVFNLSTIGYHLFIVLYCYICELIFIPHVRIAYDVDAKKFGGQSYRRARHRRLRRRSEIESKHRYSTVYIDNRDCTARYISYRNIAKYRWLGESGCDYVIWMWSVENIVRFICKCTKCAHW